MASKEKKGLEQWLEQHPKTEQEVNSLRSLWDATSTYKEGYQPDVDKGFNQFKNRIGQESAPAGRVVQMKPGLRLLKFAAAIVMVLGAVYVFKTILRSPQTETITTTAGLMQSLQLNDGTSVTMNGASELIYPEDFTANERRVGLSGEAFFEVVKDPSKPFIVETELAEIQVLGTAFNVRAYAQEDLVEVFVKTGKVAVTLKNSGKRVELTPGEKMVFDKKSSALVASVDKSDNSMAWKNGRLIFKEKTFREIFAEIERQFGVVVQVKNESLLDCRHTLAIEKDKLTEDLSSIEIACPVKFTRISADKLLVTGTCCD